MMPLNDDRCSVNVHQGKLIMTQSKSASGQDVNLSLPTLCWIILLGAALLIL